MPLCIFILKQGMLRAFAFVAEINTFYSLLTIQYKLVDEFIKRIFNTLNEKSF